MKKREKTREKARHHPTNSEVQRIVKNIRSLRDNGKSDLEIRETLDLELRTYQKYSKRIIEEDKNTWFSISQGLLSSELFKLKSSLEHTYKISKELSENEDYDDRLEALISKDNARVEIIKLLTEAPKLIQETESQLPKMETKPYVEPGDWRERGNGLLENAE